MKYLAKKRVLEDDETFSDQIKDESVIEVYGE